MIRVGMHTKPLKMRLTRDCSLAWRPIRLHLPALLMNYWPDAPSTATYHGVLADVPKFVPKNKKGRIASALCFFLTH